MVKIVTVILLVPGHIRWSLLILDDPNSVNSQRFALRYWISRLSLRC